jgi:leucyl/phenylalanyl-tRNA--protein transferase
MSIEKILTVLDPANPDQPFPPASSALKTPDGLLAIDGCLSAQRIINAYRHGIFPWFSPGEPILWWSPNPRLVLYPDNLIISRSLAKTIRRNKFTITIDQAFPEVINACAKTRDTQEGTWISDDMKQAYNRLHQQGIAHSIETWNNQTLVGGLYGLALGQVFFGESMFYKQSDASKVAFVYLAQQLKNWHYKLIDCQVRTDHLLSLGAKEIPREQFLLHLDLLCDKSPCHKAWG